MTFSEAAAARKRARENPEEERQAVEAASVALGMIDTTIGIAKVAAEGSSLFKDLKVMGGVLLELELVLIISIPM